MKDLDSILAPYRGFCPTRTVFATVTTIGWASRWTKRATEALPQAS